MQQYQEQNKGFSLCVFCGSRSGADPDFEKFAAELGEIMARSNVKLVYGGGSAGLMGAISDAILNHGGQALGVIPKFLKDREIGHQSAEIIVVPDMHSRKRMMFEHSDAFCILPGGIGTLEEFLEIITWRQLSVHNKPVILASWKGYWNNLVALADAVNAGGFGYGPTEDLFTTVHSVTDILPNIREKLVGFQPDPGIKHPDLPET
ncbi:MAG: TIGR00730 family Rossman fold protein [Rhodospirillaceae bacterium]|jgi:uncharacterized protein (TIGR00730 family)|nr:TIGR00730 family Rossman fold protein [Rhodospirillaceae bacterium]